MSPLSEAADYTGGLGSRREARERAVGLLYEAEVREMPHRLLVESLVLNPEPFAAELVVGVGDHIDDIDEILRQFARDWTLERMPAMDRAVLRLATFELTHRPEIPTGAVISEAVELAKAYSTPDSGKFVNGMLSAIADFVRVDVARDD